MRKKAAFATLGCRVNQYDTQLLREELERAAFELVPFEETADLYVINTCTVTAAADAEGRQLIRRAKARNPGSFVVVTGCLAEDRPQEVGKLPGVDLVAGNREKSRLLERIAQEAPHLPLGPRTPSPFPWGAGISRFDGHQRTTVKVQDGCDFGCSFCLIPRVRGKGVSRPLGSILQEARRLAGAGVKELVLAGIQLSSYGRDLGLKASEPRLAPVVEALLEIPGIQRVRLSSYAVADFEDALLPLFKEGSGLCPHLHLPLQSGDEGVLKAMRRPYRLEQYEATVKKVRGAAPRLGLTGDVIAGFPGESDGAFRNTLSRLREFGFTDFHPFPYSDRPGTPGEALRPKVDPGLIRERMEALLELKADCRRRAAEGAKGEGSRVIVERHSPEFSAGTTERGLKVLFPLQEGKLGQETGIRVEGWRQGRAWAEVVP